ncbi:hypothetical protein MRB53_023620 [Persea americana]|uniref:Uncharacterized protein n=1 Tax=Persea americana TaxID=3435 RepID=A0ACC2L9W9_PERAE|nr:hypothetical protein MRB53_023620 [Persea americana]
MEVLVRSPPSSSSQNTDRHGFYLRCCGQWESCSEDLQLEDLLPIHIKMTADEECGVKVDPKIQDLVDGPTLSTRGFDEFRHFVRRLPKLKF